MISDIRSKFRDPNAAELQLIEKYAGLSEDHRRARAFDAFAKTGLPHRRLEDWKWSDFRQALGLLEPASKSLQQTQPVIDGAVSLVFDGESWTVPDALPESVRIVERRQAQALGDAENQPLAALTASLTGREDELNSLDVEISPGLQAPIQLHFNSKIHESTFARIRFLIRESAALELIENHFGEAGFSSVLIEISQEPDSTVERTLVQNASRDQAVAVTSDIQLERKANYQQTALAFGARVCRIETRLSYAGPEASSSLNAVYLAGDAYHADFTSKIRHGAQSCVTRQLTKGAVSKGGQGVFQGKFLVPRIIGQHTDADMQHHALLLEEGAEVFAKPELEIYADDVECAHGNTSGQLDELALFYLRQRGIPIREARALMIEAFILEALENAHWGIRDQMIEDVREFLKSGV